MRMRRRKKEKDTLCTLSDLTIEMKTSTKSLDIWCGDFLLNGTKVGVPCGSETFKRRLANSVTVRVSV